MWKAIFRPTLLIFILIWALLFPAIEYSARANNERLRAIYSEWQKLLDSGECKVVQFGFDKYGRAETAVYQCNGELLVGPVLRQLPCDVRRCWWPKSEAKENQ